MSCVQARFHSGFGNWLYISVQVAMYAHSVNKTLALPDIIHQHFRLPQVVIRPRSGCIPIRQLDYVHASRARMRRVESTFGMPFPEARAATFRWLFGRPRYHVPLPKFQTAVHIRTVSDVRCKRHHNMRACDGACVRNETLQCVVRRAQNGPIVVISDSKEYADELRRMYARAGVSEVYDERTIVDASNHSGLDPASAGGAIRLWMAFAYAEQRVVSGGSSFSKSAVLSLPGTQDYAMDTRCRKGHPTDGNLFACRRLTPEDVV